MAEDEINKTPPDEFRKRLKKVLDEGAGAIRDEPQNQKAMKAAWKYWKTKLSEDMANAMPHLAEVLLEDFPEYPISPEEAKDSVEREWGGDHVKSFKKLHPMAHRQDIGGGGPPDVFGGPGD